MIPATFFGALFAAWNGAVAFFVVVGAVVAIVSLAQPHAEAFDSRARILLRGQRGSHIDCIIEKLRNLPEHYSVETANRIVVSDYNGTESKYHISIQSRSLVRSYINDIVPTFKSEVEYTEVTPPPSGGLPNRLVYLRFDGKSVDVGSAPPDRDLRFPYTMTIGRDAVREIAHRVDVWFVAGSEELWFSPERYVQSLTLEVENDLSETVAMRLLDLSGEHSNWREVRIAAGDVAQVLAVENVKPGSTAYKLKLSALDPPGSGNM